MIIDFHTHNFPSSLAQRAVASMLERLNGLTVPVGDGTVETELRDMERAGVDLCVNCPVPTSSTPSSAVRSPSATARKGSPPHNISFSWDRSIPTTPNLQSIFAS